MSKYRRLSGLYFSVFSPNTGTCGSDKPPYLVTFQAVFNQKVYNVKSNKIAARNANDEEIRDEDRTTTHLHGSNILYIEHFGDKKYPILLKS